MALVPDHSLSLSCIPLTYATKARVGPFTIVSLSSRMIEQDEDQDDGQTDVRYIVDWQSFSGFFFSVEKRDPDSPRAFPAMCRKHARPRVDDGKAGL